MKTTGIIEGLTILEKYRDQPDGEECYTHHDMLHIYATDQPVESDDLERLIELGWSQHDDPAAKEVFSAKHYSVAREWVCGP